MDLGIRETLEWRIAKEVLGPQRSRRTDVSYFDHIEEGIKILEDLDTSLACQQAFALHPLFQPNFVLIENLIYVPQFDPMAVLLCIEYRWVANLGTRQAVRENGGKLVLSVIPEVNTMLVADKIQNRKLFETRLPKDDPAYAEIAHYFALWMDKLDISEETYQRYAAMI